MEEATTPPSTKAEDLRRGSSSASFATNGSPMAMAETFVQASGIRTGVDGHWRATAIEHSWDAGGGYTTSIECEAADAEF